MEQLTTYAIYISIVSFIGVALSILQHWYAAEVHLKKMYWCLIGSSIFAGLLTISVIVYDPKQLGMAFWLTLNVWGVAMGIRGLLKLAGIKSFWGGSWAKIRDISKRIYAWPHKFYRRLKCWFKTVWKASYHWPKLAEEISPCCICEGRGEPGEAYLNLGVLVYCRPCADISLLHSLVQKQIRELHQDDVEWRISTNNAGELQAEYVGKKTKKKRATKKKKATKKKIKKKVTKRRKR